MRRFTGPTRFLLLVPAALALAIVSRSLVRTIPGYRAWVGSLPLPLPWLEQPLRWALIIGLALLALHGPSPRRWARDLGLSAFSPRAILLSILATTPLLLGPWFLGASLQRSESLWTLWFTALVWPLGEELLYRGFSFGQLRAYGGLGLWPAAIGTGLVFGLVHLGQASVQHLPLAGQLGAVAVVALGGLLFCWLFERWGRNLWAPLTVHGLMNFGWTLWDLDQSPLGTGSANVLRGLSVLLAVTLTWRYGPAVESSGGSDAAG